MKAKNWLRRPGFSAAVVLLRMRSRLKQDRKPFSTIAPTSFASLSGIRSLTAGPIGLGTRFKIRLDGVGWSTPENIVFHRPSFCAATSASKLLDVRLEWEVTPAGRGARLSVRTLLLPHGVLRLAQPILRPYMRQQWEHHLRRIKSRLELPGRLYNGWRLPRGLPR